MKHRFITFLTDFGLTDDFVGTCHGVIKCIAPEVQIIDVTHGITRQGVLPRRARPPQHASIHAGGRAPRRGRPRRRQRSPSGDHSRLQRGLLRWPRQRTARARGRASRDRERARARRIPPTHSSPCRGRFTGATFAPAAAHLALGVEPSELGPPLSPDALVRLDLPKPQISANQLEAHVLYVDRFGNMQLNMTRADLDQVGIVPGTRFELEIAGERYYATAARTYADHGPARSSSTRTRTGTSRSRSIAAARRDVRRAAGPARPPAPGPSVTLGQRFVRLATNAVVRRPALWRLFRAPMRRQFDRLAPSWDAMRRPDFLAPLEAALDRLPAPPKRVLDIGTGTGAAARLVAACYPEADVIGVDVSERMLDEARRLSDPRALRTERRTPSDCPSRRRRSTSSRSTT